MREKDTSEKPKLNPKTLFSLLHKYRDWFLQYRLPLGLGLLCLLAVNLLSIAIPWQIKRVIDTVQAAFTQPGADIAWWGGFLGLLGLIAGLATLSLLARIASRQYLLGTGRRMEADIRNRLYGHLLGMPPGYFSAHPAGELMSRLTNDVDATKYLTGGGIMLGVNTILAYLLTIPMMFIINAPLTLVIFVLYPIMIWVMTRISRKVRQGYYDVQEVLAEISTVGQENLSGMTVIQSYARETQEHGRFEAICDKYFGTYTRLIHERILLFMVLAGLSGFSMLLILLVGGMQVLAGGMNWGDFVAFTMYLEHLAWPTMALGWTISIFQQGTAALERIDEVLSTEPARADAEPDAPDAVDPAHLAGALEIRNLTFAYRNPYAKADEADKPPVLRDISLAVRPGETVALVGPVGSGKSTLLRLLTRLETVPPGAIFLDGHDITRLSRRRLRQAVVFMPQLSFLFSSTVSQNIAFGRPETLDEPGMQMESTIIPAAVAAGVHQDIRDLPAQYDTLVGERGLMLSGGQRQRVALARTLLMEAKVLVLDDPFSNVDAETERNIVAALRERRVFTDKTTLIATHRFSLIALCDRVVLMDGGRVVATGTHTELLAGEPLYQNLYHLQSLKETLSAWDPGNVHGGSDGATYQEASD